MDVWRRTGSATAMPAGWAFHLVLLLFLVLPAPRVRAAGITLNLTDADIEAVISTVAEVTGKNFVVDPRVKGKVTIISSHPLDREGVYQVFLSLLEVHGFAAIPSGPVIKIVPDANAKQSATPIATAAEPGSGDEAVTRVIEVHNVAAAQLVPILRPLIAQQGHLAAYPASNVLIVSDRAANVERLVEIVRRVDEPTQGEIEVIRLNYASAAEVVRILTTLGQQEKTKEAATSPVSLVADERTNTVLLSGEKSERLRLRAIISHLDTPMERGGNTTVVYLRYAQARDLVDVLTGVSKTQEEARRVQAPGQAPVAATGRGGGGPEVSIQADDSTNALVITAPPDQLRSLMAVIRQLDIRRAQVLVEAIIAEVSPSRQHELGIQWAVDASNHGVVGIINFPRNPSDPGIAGVLGGIATGGDPGLVAIGSALSSGLNLGVGSFGGDVRFAALLRALSSDTSTNVLSTPNLVTMDNQEAEIVVGQNVPFVTGSFVNTGAANAATNPFQTIQRQDVGLTLKVKPQINEGNAIKLEVSQEVSSLAPTPAGITTSDVVTNKRAIKTVVLVDDDQVVVLGGLIQDDVTKSVQKVPGLGDLPLIGALFRSKSTTVTKTNLMVFLHPVILRDPATAARVSGAKYNYMRARQMEARYPSVPPALTVPVMPALDESFDKKGQSSKTLPGLDPTLELPPPFEETEAARSRPAVSDGRR